MHIKLSAGTFEADVYQLLTRYKEGAPCAATTTSTITTAGECANPNALFAALRTVVAAQSERCSSPLNFHTSMQTYYSPFDADALFASSRDATKCRWTGSSLATTEAHPAEVHRFVKHAIESAKAAAQTSTLTLMSIPVSTRNPGYLNLLRTNTAYCNWLCAFQPQKYAWSLSQSTC
jgi:hypothetical protein